MSRNSENHKFAPTVALLPLTTSCCQTDIKCHCQTCHNAMRCHSLHATRWMCTIRTKARKRSIDTSSRVDGLLHTQEKEKAAHKWFIVMLLCSIFLSLASTPAWIQHYNMKENMPDSFYLSFFMHARLAFLPSAIPKHLSVHTKEHKDIARQSHNSSLYTFFARMMSDLKVYDKKKLQKIQQNAEKKKINGICAASTLDVA